MIRARYGRFWTLAAAAIIIVIFLTSFRSSPSLKPPSAPVWQPSKEHHDYSREKLAAQPPLPPIVPRPPLAQSTTTTSKQSTPTGVLKSFPDTAQHDTAEVAADGDHDILAALKNAAAADVADDVPTDEESEASRLLNEVAADVHDEFIENENTIEKTLVDVGIDYEGKSKTQDREPTPSQKASPTATPNPKSPGSPPDADLEHLNLAQPGIQPSSEPTTADVVKHTTIAEAAVVIQTAPSTPNDETNPAKVKRSKAVVVGRLNDEDTDWIGKELPDWQNAIYYVDLPENTTPPSGLRTRMNKAREAMPYLTYIIDHYPNFPDIVAFVHPHQKAWHNDVPSHSAIRMLKDLKLSTVAARGYVNLRCNSEPGCPDEIRPFRNPPREDKTAENAYSHVFAHFFHASEAEMRKKISVVGTQCCAQFAVSREQLLRRPKEDYERYRAYLEKTEYDDDTIGRVMEYMWHLIFGREAIHCEDLFECWCAIYGRCYSSELDKSWSGWLGLTAHPEPEVPED